MQGPGRRTPPPSQTDRLVRVVFTLLVLLLLVALAGCDTSGSPTEPTGDPTGPPRPDPNPEPDPPSSDEPRFQGFDLDLEVGDSREFYWFSKELTVSSGSTRSSTDGGSFRLSLVDQVTVAGQTAFRIEVMGEDLDGAPVPRWRYLAAHGSTLLGSTTGDSLQVVLDVQTGNVRPRAAAYQEPATDTWQTGTNRTQPYLATTGTAHTSDGVRFYTSGGFSSGTFRTNLNAYTVQTPLTNGMEWPQANGGMAEGRARHGMAVIDGLVFVVGGQTSDYMVSVEEYDPARDRRLR